MAELKDVRGVGPKSLSLLNKIGIESYVEKLKTLTSKKESVLEDDE